MTRDLAQLLGEDATPVGRPYVLDRLHHDRVSLLGYGREIKHRLLALQTRHAPQGRFVMIGRARSGTTLLARLLNQIPDIRCDGEMLHYALWDPRGHLNRLSRTSGAPVYGCKILSYQMLEVQRLRDPAAFLAGLRADGFTLVHVVRDTLAQCVSLSTAQSTNRYHRAAGWRGDVEAARLDPDLFARQVRWNRALLRFERRILRDLDPVAVTYETDLETPERHQATVDRLCAAIGARTAPVTATVRKILASDLRRSVANFDALCERLMTDGMADVVETHIK